MGNETSTPGDAGATPEEIAAAADALSGSESAASAEQQQQEEAAAATTAIEHRQPQQAAAMDGGGGEDPTPAMPAGGMAGNLGTTTASSRNQQMQAQVQQQMKETKQVMKEKMTKGMTSARSMFQRSGVGGGNAHAQQQHQQYGEPSYVNGGGYPGGGGQQGHGGHPALHHEDQYAYQQQQQYYHAQQQQQQQQQQYYHTQQQQPQQYYHAQQQQQQPPNSSNQGRRPPSLGGAVVDVMYATEGRGHHHHHHQSHQSHQGSAAASSAANQLGEQMRGMSLSSSSASGTAEGGPASASAAAAHAAHTAAVGGAKTTGLSNDEDEWQAAWEDDDESSGDEDGVDDDGGGGGGNMGAGPLVNAGGAGPAMPSSATSAAGPLQPFRVGMDGGHSSSSPVKRVGSASMMTIPPAPPLPPPNSSRQQQQQQQPMVQTSVSGAAAPASALPVVTPHETEEDVLQRQADRVLGEGLVWDMAGPAPSAGGVAPPPPGGASVDVRSAEEEKPSVSMFFPLLRVLGKGSFGKVVLVQKRTGKERGGLFAMKILRKAHLVKRRQIERTKTERKVLANVDHPFIMKLHFAFQTDDKLYLVLDYCPGGELFFHLSRYRRFPERVARFYAAELLLAIGHLHKKGIIYRDLKPENVLLDADGHVKLGDFGLAKDSISHPCVGATSMCGTPEYMAPEVLGQSGHGFCVDYWGLGMLVYEMMTGLPPWYTTDRTKLFRRLKSAPLDIPTYFSVQSASYVSALLERNPRKRLGVFGIKSAMQHEFFREIDWRALRDRRIEAPIRPCEGWKASDASRSNGDVPTAAKSNASLSSRGGDSGQKQISQNELDVATANFDQTFTRMAVNTEDAGNEAQYSGDEGDGEELNERTFVGFTFDEKDNAHSRNVETARVRGGTSNPQARRG